MDVWRVRIKREVQSSPTLRWDYIYNFGKGALCTVLSICLKDQCDGRWIGEGTCCPSSSGGGGGPVGETPTMLVSFGPPGSGHQQSGGLQNVRSGSMVLSGGYSGGPGGGGTQLGGGNPGQGQGGGHPGLINLAWRTWAWWAWRSWWTGW